jgi:hypothetical protein
MSAGLRTNYDDGGAAPAAGEIVASDMNAISAAVNSLFPSSTSQASSATTLTLTAASDPVQIITGTTQAQTVALPTTSVAEGDQWMIVNSMTTALVTVNASGGATVATVAPGTAAVFTATVNTPTTAANWLAQYAGTVVAAGKVLTVSNTLTLAGVDGTTITIPATTAVVTGEQLITSTAARTLTSQTAAQKLFATPTNGAVTLQAGTYFFQCCFSLSAMSTTTSGAFGFALAGTATIAAQAWWASASKVAALTTPATAMDTYNTAANANLSGANTSALGFAIIRGKIRISAAGTIIPSVSLGVAAAAVVAADAFFRVWPVGAATVNSVGNWA